MAVSAFLALAAALLFGAATPLSKLLLGRLEPLALAGLLYLGAGLATAPRALKGGLARKLRGLDRRNRLLVLGSVLLGGMLGPALMLLGLRAARSSSVSLWLNLELVCTGILGHFLFRDRMTRRGAAAAAGILAASLLLSFDGTRTSVSGGLLVAAACLAWGFDNHFTALIDGLRPEESTFLKGAVAGAANLSLSLLSSGWRAAPPALVGGALLIGALSYGLSIVLYIEAAQGLGASRAQLFFSSSPLFGILIAAAALGEPISGRELLALALSLLSFALLFSERHGHEHRHEATVHTHWHRHGEGHHDHAHEVLSLLERIFGHSHEHAHEALDHDHPHVADIHHRHVHA